MTGSENKGAHESIPNDFTQAKGVLLLGIGVAPSFPVGQ